MKHHTFKINAEESTDVLVVGGGMAAVCAAIAAARNGCATTLIEMDECLGGNSGPMLGVHVSGAHSFHPYASETGIIEELELEAARLRTKTRTWGNHYNISHSWDLLLEDKLHQAGVRVFRRCQGRDAIVENRRVTGVVALDIEHFRTLLFHVNHAVIDGSGDGIVARSAGASCMIGTEGAHIFGERSGKPESNAETMGTSITALVRKCREPVEFHMPPEFATRARAEEPPSKLTGFPASWQEEDEFCFLWVTENGGNRDTIQDAAEIRQEILYQLYRTWDNVKNYSFVEKARNWELVWVSPKSGKRESHRFIGDYVLTQTDVENATRFADAIGYGGYGVDIHEADGSRAKVVFYSIPPLWTFPYRSCYSVDFDNVWLTGRLMSVSHLALGTVRLMRTLSAIGQGVGTAVALARQKECSAREIGTEHIQELQQLLLRQDATILDTPNQDAADLARKARVTATSQMVHGARRPSRFVPLDISRGIQLWDWASTLESVELFVRNRSTRAEQLHLDLSEFSQERPWKDPGEHFPARHIRGTRNRMEWGVDNRLEKFVSVAQTSVEVPAGHEGWLQLSFPTPVRMGSPDPTSDECRYNLMLTACPNLEIAVDALQYDFALAVSRPADEDSLQTSSECYSFSLTPAPPYGEAANVIDGHNRRYSSNPVHAWLSDFTEPLPQCIALEFAQEQTIGSVQITFDTIDRAYRDAPINCDEAFARRCVKAYRLQAETPSGPVLLAEENDNYLRQRMHTFGSITATRIKLSVLEMRDPEFRARVYEIRAYGPEMNAGFGMPEER